MSSDGSIRLSGVASGIDTQAIIDSILTPQRERITAIEDEIELSDAKLEIWADIANQMQSFGEVVATLKSSASTSVFNQKTVTSSDSTVLTAVASASAVPASYPIDVDQLAQSHVITSNTSSTYNWADDDGLDETITFNINDTTVSLTAGDTLDEIISNINALTWGSDDKEVIASKIEVATDEFVLVLQGKTASQDIAITTTAGATINSNDGTALSRMMYGVDAVPSETPASPSRALNLLTGANAFQNEVQAKQQASVTLFSGGSGITLTSSTNTITEGIPGVTLSLIKTGTSNVSVAVDTSEIKESIVELVTSYNDTRNLLQRTRDVTVDDNEDFGPFFSDSLLRRLYSEIRGLTTGVVRAGDQTNWANDGTALTVTGVDSGASTITVDNFNTVGAVLSKGDKITINGDIYTLTQNATVNGFNQATLYLSPGVSSIVAADTVAVSTFSLSQFGIDVDTSSGTGVEGVLKIVDEGKLDKALIDSLDKITLLLQRDGTDELDSGVAQRLYDWVDSQTKISNNLNQTRSIDNLKVDTINREKESLKSQIERLEERIAQREQILIQQFSRMEAAMSKAQSVQGSLQSLQSG